MAAACPAPPWLPPLNLGAAAQTVLLPSGHYRDAGEGEPLAAVPDGGRVRVLDVPSAVLQGTDGGDAAQSVEVWALTDAGCHLLGLLSPQADGTLGFSGGEVATDVVLVGRSADGRASAPVSTPRLSARLVAGSAQELIRTARALPVLHRFHPPPDGGKDFGPGTVAAAAVAAPVWEQRHRGITGGTRPSTRNDHALAADHVSGDLLMLGGTQGQADLLWRWDGAEWTNTSGVVPRRVIGAHMDDHPALGAMVVFGGAEPDRTWALVSPPTRILRRGALETWQGGEHPPPRIKHAQTYDPERGVLFIHAGRAGATPGVHPLLHDTWEFDGRTWTNRTPPGDAGPGGRDFAAAAPDPVRGGIILFGGELDINSLVPAETWWWRDGSWSRLVPASQPPARSFHAMATDQARRRVVLFGGGSASGVLGDTWEWDGSAWTAAATAHAPAPRTFATLAYQPRAGGVVLFGGRLGDGRSANDLWLYDGTDWHDLGPAFALAQDGGQFPSRRYQHAGAYDQVARRVVAVGGSNGEELRGAWTWDGYTWQRTADLPAGRHGSLAAAASLGSAGGILVVGGRHELTSTGLGLSEWLAGAWNPWLPPAPPEGPAARYGAAAVLIPGAGVLVVGGATDAGVLQDTWLIQPDGGFTAAPGAALGARAGHGAAWCASRQVVVAHGGGLDDQSARRDTWIFSLDGGWQGVSSAADGPSSRRGASLVEDPSGGAVLLLGHDVERQAPVPPGEVWAFDGTRWQRGATAETTMPVRQFAMAALDPARGRVVVHGGQGNDGSLDDATWELDLGHDRQPAVQWTGSVPIPPGGRVTALDVTARCGGRSTVAGDAGVTGGALWLWEARSGAWLQVEVGTADQPWDGTVAPVLDYSDHGAPARWFTLDGQFALQCRPVGTAGAGLGNASAALGTPEVVVHLERP